MIRDIRLKKQFGYAWVNEIVKNKVTQMSWKHYREYKWKRKIRQLLWFMLLKIKLWGKK